MLLSEGELAHALRVSATFTAVSVAPKLALALVLASLLALPTAANRALRSLFFMPVILSSVAVGIVFDLRMNTELGTFNRLLGLVGLAPVRWLTDPGIAILSIALIDAWKSFGYDVVIYAAALQAIPVELYEAARLDGANRRQLLRRITVPLIMPTTSFLLVLSVINSFQAFTFIDVMTEGGPARATEVVVHYLVRVGFRGADTGLGSAIAVVLFALLLALTALKFAAFRGKVHVGHDRERPLGGSRADGAACSAAQATGRSCGASSCRCPGPRSSSSRYSRS